MPLSKQQVDDLMHLVGLTKNDEINCEECLAQVAEFAERELAGKPIPDALKCVQHHLAICAECHEEYEALRQALRKIDD